MRTLLLSSLPSYHIDLKKKTAQFPGRQKEKLLLSQELCVGIIYFLGLGKRSSQPPEQSGGLFQA
jgi:hypothetical protein